jgi:excisionase family DNA binding protein
MEQFILSPITLTELKAAISSILDEKIKPFLPTIVTDSNSNDIYLSRDEVSRQLKISKPTLHNLTLQGTITGYRIGRRVLYKRNEIEAALHQITAHKYKRKDISK